jgi:hypothetical protein
MASSIHLPFFCPQMQKRETASPEALPQQITVVVLYFIDITDQMTFQDIAEILLNFALSTNWQC